LINQLNLKNNTPLRPADYCDGTKGMRYHINDTTGTQGGSNPPCISQEKDTFGPVEWPKQFIQQNSFLGVDSVNQKQCNHFYARPININGTDYQFDAWTDVSTGFPCQVSVQRIVDSVISTYAFDGFNNRFPSDAKMCIAAKMQCAQRDWECRPKQAASDRELEAALGWVCDNQDCGPINPGGKNYFPNTLRDHCTWAFTTYFRTYKMQQGYGACDFAGNAELVPPNNTIVEKRSVLQEPSIWTVNLVCG